MSLTRMQGLTFLAHMANDGFELVLPTLLPLIATEMSLSYLQVGILGGCMIISLGAGQFFTGYLSDYTGRRKMLIVGGLLCLSVSFYFMGISQSYTQLVMWNLLAGLGASVYHPVSVSFISNVFKHQKGRALGIHGAGGNLGMTISPVIAGILAQLYGWRFVFRVFPVAGIVICILFMVLLKEEPGERRKVHVRSLFVRKIFLVIISLGFVSMASRGLTIFLPLKLYDLQYTSATFGLFLSLFNGFGIIGQVVGGHLSDIYEKPKIISAMSILSGVLMYVLLSLPQYYAMIGFVCLAGLLFNSIWPTLFGLLTDRTPEELHGTGLGLFFSVGYIMSSGAPVLMGAVTDMSSMQASFVLVPIFAFLGGLIILKR